MLDLGFIRKNSETVKKSLAARHSRYEEVISELLQIDEEHRKIIQDLEALNQKKNEANKAIVTLKSQGGDVDAKLKEMKVVSDRITELKNRTGELSDKIRKILLYIPNVPSSDTPPGQDASSNKEVRTWGQPRKFEFKPKNHIEIGEHLGVLDFERSSKISGASFIVFKNKGAQLERALIQFMLDTHTSSHGYTEVSTPFLVKRHCMEGTGQLPKFEEDMYRIYRGSADTENGEPHPEDLFLIPTAEVPVTNLHRDEILDASKLPIQYCAYSPCFRLEAGTYGKDTRGMVRVHQFDKVELVKFVTPETSEKEHEALLQHAEVILQQLEIPYRVVQLCAGDLGFSARKCYDIEIWAPGTDKWLEASSCSNFGDFQAIRAGIRYKDPATKKTQFVHTLNGSGVALARTFIAILENYQEPDGTVRIPKVLQRYMGNQPFLEKS